MFSSVELIMHQLGQCAKSDNKKRKKKERHYKVLFTGFLISKKNITSITKIIN